VSRAKPGKAAGLSGTTANPERGEHAITLAGKTYVLRPSFTAVRAIEAETGKSLITLSRLGNLGDLSLDQVGIVASHLIRAGATDELDKMVSAERIAELAYEEGLPHVMARLTLLLVDAATGGRTATGEAKAVAGIMDPATAA
jgi:hypothetical protein